MPHAWRVARLLATPAVIACCAILPSGAGASVPVPVAETLATVDTTVAGAVAPVSEAADDVAQAALPASSGVSRPDAGGEQHPVADTVAPIAHAATAPVASSPAAVAAQKRLDERAQPRTSHITASSSGMRMSSGRIAHGHGSDGVTSLPSSGRAAPAHRAPVALMDASAAPRTAARSASAQPAVQSLSPATSAPGAGASSGSGGFFFGGGCALLVACLLVAGPRLRRQLAQLPAVCRPAAFLVVLERPG